MDDPKWQPAQNEFGGLGWSRNGGQIGKIFMQKFATEIMTEPLEKFEHKIKIASSCGFVISHTHFHRTLSRPFAKVVSLHLRISEPMNDAPQGYVNVCRVVTLYGNFSNH